MSLYSKWCKEQETWVNAWYGGVPIKGFKPKIWVPLILGKFIKLIWINLLRCYTHISGIKTIMNDKNIRRKYFCNYPNNWNQNWYLFLSFREILSLHIIISFTLQTPTFYSFLIFCFSPCDRLSQSVSKTDSWNNYKNDFFEVFGNNKITRNINLISYILNITPC